MHCFDKILWIMKPGSRISPWIVSFKSASISLIKNYCQISNDWKTVPLAPQANVDLAAFPVVIHAIHERRASAVAPAARLQNAKARARIVVEAISARRIVIVRESMAVVLIDNECVARKLREVLELTTAMAGWIAVIVAPREPAQVRFQIVRTVMIFVIDVLCPRRLWPKPALLSHQAMNPRVSAVHTHLHIAVASERLRYLAIAARSIERSAFAVVRADHLEVWMIANWLSLWLRLRLLLFFGLFNNGF
jgi:hypothetical protein